jgi:hypothetical protein
MPVLCAHVSMELCLLLALSFCATASSTWPDCSHTRREKVIHGIAANGTYESRPGAAPKVVYNQARASMRVRA